MLAALDALKPDVIFLDIQMPEIDGFEVIRRRTPERMPAVVFLTAYDQFAIRAFEAEAHDYLVKPVSEARFAATIRRLAKRLRSEASALARARHRGLDAAGRQGARAARDRLDRGGRQLRATVDGRPQLPAARIARTAGAAVRAHGFARAHRQALVRVAGVRALQASEAGELVAVLSMRREGPGLPPPPRRVLPPRCAAVD